MKKLCSELINNESGLILSAELVLVLTIAVLGIIVGLATVQNAVVTEFQDIALAFAGLNQSFSTPGFVGCRKRWGGTSFTSGSGFIDFYDGCIGNGNWGGGGGFGGGGYGGGGGGGFGGGYAEIGGNGYVSSRGSSVQTPQSTTTPCEVCTPETSPSGVVVDQMSPTPANSNPTPLPPPPIPTKDH